jgi:hypothetical protein
MNDCLGLGVLVFLVAVALAGMARQGGPRRRMSAEEFEERARGGAYTRAGLFGLQQLLHPKVVKAVEVQQDLKSGYYDKKRVPGDGDDGNPEGVKGKGERGEGESAEPSSLCSPSPLPHPFRRGDDA